jgi:hypothetical protein
MGLLMMLMMMTMLARQVGNQKPRFRDGYRMALRLVCLVHPPPKVAVYLLGGLVSKNVRSRAECLDELCHLVRETGYRTVGRKGLQRIAALIPTAEKDVRDAAIDVMEALWLQVRGAAVDLSYRCSAASRPARSCGLSTCSLCTPSCVDGSSHVKRTPCSR